MQLEWTDEHGSHREQGDLHMLLEGDQQASVRIEKFGDVMLWAGWTPQETWLFDLTGDTSVLQVVPATDRAALVFPPPAILRYLLAVDPLPASSTVESRDDHLLIAVDVTCGTMEIEVEPEPLRPIRIRVLDEAGSVWESTPRWTTGSTPITRAPAARPLATTFDLVGPEEGLLKLSLRSVVALTPADMEAEITPWFDRERIAVHLQPDRIE